LDRGNSANLLRGKEAQMGLKGFASEFLAGGGVKVAWQVTAKRIGQTAGTRANPGEGKGRET